MPNKDLNTNEVIVNGQVIMTTRNDTVTPQTLVKDETATNKEGAKIVGELDPVSHNEAYLIDDPEGDIDDSDYIPFNDVSDEEQPKKKTLFSSIVDKLRTIFVSKSWGHVELVPTTETLGIKDKEVDATASDNDVTANHYPSSNDIKDKNDKIIARSEAIVYPNGTITAKMYAQNYDTNGNSVGQNAINLNVDKSGAFSYNVSDPNAFRSAIKTVDQLGTDIPSNADLNTYKTAGTYRVPSDAIGATISNLPLALCGKVVVFNNGNGGFEQFYFPNHSPRIFVRTWWSNTWSTWKEIGEGGDSKDHTYELGTLIPNGSDANDYTTEGIYYYSGLNSTTQMTNFPHCYYGGTLIVSKWRWGNDEYVQQTFMPYNYNAPVRMYKRSNMGGWQKWVEYANLGEDTYTLNNDTYNNSITNLTTGTDLNTIVAHGTYYGGSSGNYVNCPVNGYQFKMVVDQGLISQRQIITVVDNGINTDGGIWTRQVYAQSTVHSDTTYYWTPWVNILEGSTKPHTYEKGTEIPSTADLNDYTTEGVYYVQNGTIAESIGNIPIAKAGKLIVMARDTGVRRFQIYIGSKDDIYMRDMDNNREFSLWRNISKPHTYETGIEIPANSDLNTYTTIGVYQCLLSATARTMSNLPYTGNDKHAFKLIVSTVRGTANIIQMWIPFATYTDCKICYRTTDDNGTTWQTWKQLASTDDLKPHTYEVGTSIPASSDLNTYIVDGVYKISPDATAQTIVNIPSHNNTITGGKLVVSKGYSANENYIIQTYYSNDNYIFVRRSTDSGTTWFAWKQLASTDDISPSTVGNGYAVATVSGTAITATISGFKLRAGVIVALKISHFIGTACTLNINNTGAKQVLALNNSQISEGYPIVGGYVLYTFMYDGTNYRILSWDATPSIAQQDYVADTSGNIIVNWGYDVNRAQIKYGLSTNKLSWNYYKNSAWRGDVKIADYDDLITTSLKNKIPASSNLNLYNSEGVYYIASDSDAQTLVNRPTNSAGKLVVIKAINTSTKLQYYLCIDDSIFARHSYDNGSNWSAWKRLVNTNDLREYFNTYCNDYGVKNIFPWDVTTDIFKNLNYTTHTLASGIVNVTVTNESTNKGVYINTQTMNAYLADFNGKSLILSCEAKFDDAQHNLSFGLDNNYADYSVGTNWTYIERTITLDTSLTNNHWHFYLQLPQNVTYHIRNLMIRPAIITSSEYEPFSLTNQQIVNGLGASVAKVGKSILPLWDYTTNTWSTNGITFTFNPTTGQITVNGTATADVDCRLLEPTKYQFRLPKGEYILSGCPSGGSDTKYSIRLAVYDGTNVLGFNDYGNGCKVTLSKDCYSSVSANTGFFLIRVKSGQTLSNLLFKPMLRPAYTTDEHEPCEDIHKGNCYVGTCTTAGATKDKVAYVDGYFVLRKGVRVAIKYSNTNSYSSTASSPVTLNVNNTGAKNIWWNNNHTGAVNHGTNTVIFGVANRYVSYMYDGTYWVWDGESLEENSTNFLRNDASSTMTTSTPVLTLKASNIDLTQANNGVTSTQYPAYTIVDKNGKTMARFEAITETNGNISSFLYAGNIKTSDGTHFNGGIKLIAKKDGSFTWNITGDKASFHNNIGIGYCACSTAEATLAKTANLKDYALCHGSIVVVHFSYNVPANSTLNINGQGAKAIYYRGTAIKAGIIMAGDRATFIYDGTNYQLVGIDRISFGRHDCITMSNLKWGTVASTLVKTDSSYTVRGDIIGGVLYFNMEINFKANGTLPSYASENGGIFMIPNITTLRWRMAHAEYNNSYISCYTTSTTYNGSTGLMFMLRRTLAVTTGASLKVCFEVPVNNGVTF